MIPDVEWPMDFAERYRALGLWESRTLGEVFWSAVEEHAASIAVVDGARRVSYAELGALVGAAAERLLEAGLEGESVVFQMPNSLEFVVGYFACLVAGAVPIACQPAHRHAEIEKFVGATRAAAWFVPAEHRNFDYRSMIAHVLDVAPSLRHVFVLDGTASSDPRMRRFEELMTAPAPSLGRRPLSRARSRDVAVLQLSGGSTAIAKLIPRTHDDYLYVSRESARAMDVDASTVFLTPLPLAHNFSLATPGIQAVLIEGGRVVIAPTPSPSVVLPLVQSERVTWIPSVPATLIGWLDHPTLASFDVSSVRSLYVGGQRLNPEPARRARAVFGEALQQIYGMAEGLICCTRRGDPEDVVLATQGRPISVADEIRIVDESGVEVAPGELGELETRGAYTVRGYQSAGELNRVAFTEDGFYRTGDLVRAHPSGNLAVEGRRKDVINRGGEKIAADELEALILEHPRISNVAIVPYPDHVLGERVCAFVTLRDGGALSLPELVEYLRDVKRISPGSVPERMVVRESLPTTAVGKISKTELKDAARRLAAEEERTSSGR